jgi:HAD superfamily hydrolase (TIGR01509 family)
MDHEMPLKAYFTDLGGCLFPDYLDAACQILVSKHGVSPDLAENAKQRLWNRHAYQRRANEATDIAVTDADTEAQAWTDFAAHAGIDASAEEIISTTAECARPLDPGYEGLMERLQNHGIILGVISNNTRFFWNRQRAALSLERFVPLHRVVLSCDHGVSKTSPGLDLFKTAVEASGVKASECIFVDDRAHNIECALRAGFAMAILHPKSVPWGSTYITKILNQTGLLPPSESPAASL